MSLFYDLGLFFLSSCKMPSLCWWHYLVAFEIFSCPLLPMVGSGSLARLKRNLPPRWHRLPSSGMPSEILMLWAKHLSLRNPESRQIHILSKSYNIYSVFSNSITKQRHLLDLFLSKGVSYFISVGSLPNQAIMHLIWYLSVPPSLFPRF